MLLWSAVFEGDFGMRAAGSFAGCSLEEAAAAGLGESSQPGAFQIGPKSVAIRRLGVVRCLR